jgi:amino acid adenylation domain-containing protein
MSSGKSYGVRVTQRAQHTCSATAFEPFPDAALEQSIPDRFAFQVTRHRDCVAIVDSGRALTYRELDAWSNGIAHAILERAPAARDPVALVVSQGAAYSAAVLGVLKTGRPYVPLDPHEPPARLAGFLDACAPTVVIVERATRALIGSHLALVDIETIDAKAEPPASDAGANSVAYVFFTSGSTGEPKGVYDSHRNVLHNVLRYTNALEIAPTDRLTLLQGPAFSGCVSSQLGALLNGAASLPFRFADEGLRQTARWLREERATIYHSVPAIFRAVAGLGGTFPDIRVVRLEGDRATSQDAEVWKQHFSPESLLANGLGTTETGLARQLVVRRSDSVERGPLPVGFPVRDVHAFVVDADRRALQNGEVGEIAVASEYLALGYWNRPDLTEGRFETRDGSRMYFTGDLGRLRTDGCLEYLGRAEGDVKVLGVRVEPAEVERELLRLEDVREAAVSVREGWNGEGRVVAYVVPRPAAELDLASLRAALGPRLPAALVPTALVELDELPLGPNRKLDRTALPDPPDMHEPSTAPATDVERMLTSVWADVLGVSVGASDDFFALGGDSLSAAEIVARIEVETGLRLSASILAGRPTVAELAAWIDRGSALAAPSLVVLSDGAGTPLYLLHGKTGNALRYAGLAHTLGRTQPIRAFEYLETDDFGIEAIAAQHVQALLAAEPDGPYVLAGFCYGAVIAREMACQLAARGREVALLALLGITPLDFPTLVSREAHARWNSHVGSSSTLGRKLRRHVRRASELPRLEATRYLARSGTNLLLRPVRWKRNPHLPAVYAALAAYAPGPYEGSALVLLHEEDTAPYTADPQRDWRGLASSVEIVMLPGRDHAMMEEPGVEAVADLFRRRLPETM